MKENSDLSPWRCSSAAISHQEAYLETSMLTTFLCCSEHSAYSLLGISWNCFCFFAWWRAVFFNHLIQRSCLVISAQGAEIKHPLIWQPKSLMRLGTFATNLAPTLSLLLSCSFCEQKYLIWTFDQQGGPFLAVLLKEQAKRINFVFTSKKKQKAWIFLCYFTLSGLIGSK